MQFMKWPALSIVAGAFAVSSLACRHDAPRPEARPPAAVPTFSIDRSDSRTITTVEAEPPGGQPDTVVEADMAPLEGPAEIDRTLDRRKKQPSIVDHSAAENDTTRPIAAVPATSRPVPPASAEAPRPAGKGALPTAAFATLKPQKGGTLEGTATVLESTAGGRMAVDVKLGTPGEYAVLLFDAGRACNEKRTTKPPPVRTHVGTPQGGSKARAEESGPGFVELGTITVRATGIGRAELSLPVAVMPRGIKALEQRPLVIYEGRPEAHSMLEAALSNSAAACGMIEIATDDEPVG